MCRLSRVLWSDWILLKLRQITKRLYSSRHFLTLSLEGGHIIPALVWSIKFWSMWGGKIEDKISLYCRWENGNMPWNKCVCLCELVLEQHVGSVVMAHSEKMKHSCCEMFRWNQIKTWSSRKNILAFFFKNLSARVPGQFHRSAHARLCPAQSVAFYWLLCYNREKRRISHHKQCDIHQIRPQSIQFRSLIQLQFVSLEDKRWEIPYWSHYLFIIVLE